MDPQERTSIERACEQLSIEYARSIDFRDYDRFVELFADDAVLTLGFTLSGKDNIKKSMSKRPDELRSRHVMTNIFIDVISPTQARGISYLTLYRHTGPDSLTSEPVDLAGPAAVGHYEDRFCLKDGEWLFASRRLHVSFRDAKQFP